MNSDNIAEWREALLLPGETNLIESGLRELAEYLGVSREDALLACENALAESKREWDSAPRRTPDQIVDFYRRTRSYLFEHTWWHATDVEMNAVNVEIMKYAEDRGARKYLDFGSGVGGNAILFARRGFDVTIADVSPKMLDFARWRLERRGLKAAYIDLNEQHLRPEGYDFITAVDVCEHLADPGAELKRLSEALKVGGVLVFNYRAGFDKERPMHILATAAPILRALRRNGLREAGENAADIRRLDFCVVERGEQSRVEDLLFGAYDRLRYSRLFMLGEIHMAGKTNGQVRHPQRVYFERIGRTLTQQTRWLDLGCGRQLVPWWLKGQAELESELKSHAKFLIGIDPDLAALRDNGSCHLSLKADAEALPFGEGCLDLVTSNMVFEHVKNPRAILAEIRRVLSPGGRLIVLTPNWLDIVTIAARATPNRFHPALVSKVEARGEQDVYPTHFRFNRPATVERLLRETGYRNYRIEPLNQPDTYAHVPLFSKIESAWHRLARRWPALKGTLLIEAEK
jgi:2-polyprenyl-3-methyl-5-hydroxy-6-metoxy-1,4-benzoquinol methylase